MKSYRITWEIERDAEGTIEAAAKALEIHSSPGSEATVSELKKSKAESLNLSILTQWKFITPKKTIQGSGEHDQSKAHCSIPCLSLKSGES